MKKVKWGRTKRKFIYLDKQKVDGRFRIADALVRDNNFLPPNQESL